MFHHFPAHVPQFSHVPTPGGSEGGAQSPTPQHPRGGTAPRSSSAGTPRWDGYSGSLCAEPWVWEALGYTSWLGKIWENIRSTEKMISVLGNNGTYEIIENLRSLQSIWHE